MALNAVDRVKYDHKSIGMFKCVCMVIGLGIGIIILEDLRFGHYVVEPFLEFFERVCKVINKLLLLFSDWNYLRTKQTKRIATFVHVCASTTSRTMCITCRVVCGQLLTYMVNNY